MNNKILIAIGAAILVAIVWGYLSGKKSEDRNKTVEQLMAENGWDESQAIQFKQGK